MISTSRNPASPSAEGRSDGRSATATSQHLRPIKTVKVAPGRYRAFTRFRDWDGETRQVSTTGTTQNEAATALKVNWTPLLGGWIGLHLVADKFFAIGGCCPVGKQLQLFV
ncbi:MAG: hypothetical protein JWL94_1854 [Microbacteriaceae bacterium]|jgi:hypothetical protein|nr:hypothetical protein [Microbacteriaceae bacterium]